MNTTPSSTFAVEVPGYVGLQREIHNALRAQHPEWIEADGKSPTCDYYESRFAELLVSHRAHARVHHDDLLNITRTERFGSFFRGRLPGTLKGTEKGDLSYLDVISIARESTLKLMNRSAASFASLPICSIIRPTETDGAAMGAVRAFTRRIPACLSVMLRQETWSFPKWPRHEMLFSESLISK
jgi:hypothetical protein